MESHEAESLAVHATSPGGLISHCHVSKGRTWAGTSLCDSNAGHLLVEIVEIFLNPLCIYLVRYLFIGQKHVISLLLHFTPWLIPSSC